MTKKYQVLLRKPRQCSAFLMVVVLAFLTTSLSGCVGERSSDEDETEQTGTEARFNHPGLLHSEADFARIREKVQDGEEPWASAWQGLTSDTTTDLNRHPNPVERLYREGPNHNVERAINDIKFSYAMALRWKISGDERYADRAVEFLNAWSETLRGEIWGGSSRYLVSGLQGYQFANIGEIMRTYDGWAQEDRKRFEKMLLDTFYYMNHRFLREHNGTCISSYWANWGLSNIASMLAIGVFTDRPDIYLEAMDYLYTGEGNAVLANLVYHLHPGNMGQYQESGRDQGHSTLGPALFGVIAEMAWNQGDDLFAYDNYRPLAAFEYIARYNLLEEVPYTPYGPNCGSSTSPQTVVSEIARGNERDAWEVVYNHYVNRLGMAAPWITKMAERQRPEKSSWGGDELGWGTLTESLETPALGGAPRGLTAELNDGSVILSWWGAFGAESYRLKRADSPDGPFSTVATRSAEELLTYTDTDVADGEDYYYQATAISPVGESEASNTVAKRVGTQLMVHFPFEAAKEGGFASSVDDTVVATPGSGVTLVPGKLGNAIALNGVDDYLSLPDGIVSELADFSITSWVYIDSTADMARLFDFGFGTQRYMALVPRTRDNKMCFFITKISHYADQTICGAAVPVGEWAHVAITLSGTTGILYLNGSEVGRNENMVLAPFRLGESRQNWLGDSQYSADALLHGKIDDFRIYSGALTTLELGSLIEE